MIFIALFIIILSLVLALNIYDNSNLEKIKEYYLQNKCTNVIYSKGFYKGICKEYVVLIPNSFSPNLQKDKKMVKLNNIKQIKKDNLTIILNKNYKIEFKEEKNLNSFYKSIEERIK